jgi:hypothetical protein
MLQIQLESCAHHLQPGELGGVVRFGRLELVPSRIVHEWAVRPLPAPSSDVTTPSHAACALWKRREAPACTPSLGVPFVAGRYRSSCDTLSCLEEVTCCPISGPTTCIDYAVNTKNQTNNAGGLFPFVCPADMVLNGLYRNDENDLGGITKFKCCSIGVPPTAAPTVGATLVAGPYNMSLGGDWVNNGNPVAVQSLIRMANGNLAYAIQEGAHTKIVVTNPAGTTLTARNYEGTIADLPAKAASMDAVNVLADAGAHYTVNKMCVAGPTKPGALHCVSDSLANCVGGPKYSANTGIADLTTALTVCAQTPGCGRIMKYNNNLYYLRKANDPVETNLPFPTYSWFDVTC